MKPILEIQNISKKFQIHHQGLPYLSFRDKLTGLFSPREKKEDFWALKNISFSIERGESVGIIGRNGAGKSTLLKILSRITPPTTGRIISRGRIASLLEVGTGFHQELSGRENIYMNGSILGMKKWEIDSKFDEIVDFSGVVNFLDTPLKHYSSGMQLRLAFSVAAYLEPEILIVDEILAVGDAEFQKKCLGKMEDVTNQGRTVLFVSHNMGIISKLCTRGVFLQNGTLQFEGSINEAIVKYFDNQRVSDVYEKASSKKDSHFDKLKVISVKGDLKSHFRRDEPVMISAELTLRNGSDFLTIGFAVLDKFENKVFTTLKQIGMVQINSIIKVEVTIPAKALLAGNYYIDGAIFIPNMPSFEYLKKAVAFEVEDEGSEFAYYLGADIGVVNIDCQWNLHIV